MDRATLVNSTRSSMNTTQTSNKFVSNIHIITKPGINMISTYGNSASLDGILQNHLSEVLSGDGKLADWIDSHTALDEALTMGQNNYIIAYQLLSQTRSACVIVDIKPETIMEFIDGLDLGDGSIIGFVTINGREIISEKLGEGKESILQEGSTVFFGQPFSPVRRQRRWTA